MNLDRIYNRVPNKRKFEYFTDLKSKKSFNL